ncbi:MAG: glycosyltransferase 87 family protein [Planctomycetota bacterium]
MPPRQRWLLLWIALATLVVVRATTRPDHRGVLLDHLEFGRRLVVGEDVYGDWRSDPDAPVRPLHAPYPPSFGLLTAPFAGVDAVFGLRAARCAWALLQLGALVALLRALRALARDPPPHPTDREHRWLALLAIALLSRFLLRDTHGGGGNLINVALCTLAFAAAEQDRPARAGWLLGFSLATKPTQVLLLPLLLVFGHRRAAAHAAAAGLALALLSLLLLRGDPAPWQRWFEGSLALAAQTDAFAAPALAFPEFEWMNQSLRCATARWLGTVPPEFAARVELGMAPGLGLPAWVAAAAARAITLGGLAWLLVAAFCARRRSGPALHERAVDGAAAARPRLFAAALVLSLLASPLSWKAHHVALLPLVYLLLLRTWRTRSRGLAALLAAFAVCCGFGKAILGDAGDEWLNSVYVLPLFDVALLVAALRGPAVARAA